MVSCEGYEIAYSQIDSTCEGCRVSAHCKKVTNRKLLTAKLKGEPMDKTLTKEQLAGLLEAATLKKEVAMINKKYGFGCALVKGMTIEEAKELILETAFPTPPPEDDDGFELDDEDTGSDEFDDFEDSDSVEAADEQLDDQEVQKKAEASLSNKEADVEADDDLEGLEDADLDDNPDADATACSGPPNEPDQSPDIPEGLDEEEYDSLINRIANMEKRLDDIYEIVAASKTGKKAAAAAGSDVADEGEKLKAGMPYSEEDLDKMNAKIIKKLCKAIGINSFQKKVADLLPQILEYQDANCK